MINQVEALRASGIDASSLNSTTPEAERRRIQRDLESGHPRTRLLYVTPEACAGDKFRRRLQLVYEQKELARIAIDEAHCISEWGHDFRKDFKRLSWFRETFPDVPITCVTATANLQVRKDIMSILGLVPDSDRTKSFIMTPHRENLHLEIRYTQDQDNDERMSDFLLWIRGVYERRKASDRKKELQDVGERPENVPGIIYTISRDECESIASTLCQEGIAARPFHAKLSPQVKEETLSKWVDNQPGYDIIVATTAFGMGIDKDNVRFVVHWRLPKSFEGYYQEVGRAGRDGNASYCFLYYSREDLERNNRMIGSDPKGGGNLEARRRSLNALAQYCENVRECRHAVICSYFGADKVKECDFACDWHKDADDLDARYMRGLASPDFIYTQALQGTYDVNYDTVYDDVY